MKRKDPGPVGNRIKVLREAKGLTQLALAKELDLHETAVSHWECGDSFPAVEKLAEVADILGTTIAALIAGEPAFAALAQMIEAKAS